MSDAYVGQISLLAFKFAPKGWAQCNGQLMQIEQNQALFALIGAAFGGNAVSTFALPDLRGRVPVGYGVSGPVGTVALGEIGGSETVTVQTPQLPGHTHTLAASTQVATRRVPAGRLLAADTSTNAEYYAPPGQTTVLSPDSIGLFGGGQAHENRQPYLTINYCIALVGIYPSRN